MKYNFFARRFTMPLFVCTVLFSTLATGCGNKDAASTGSTAAPMTATQKINTIDSNPNMPPQAKEAARAAIQGQQQRGKLAAPAK